MIYECSCSYCDYAMSLRDFFPKWHYRVGSFLIIWCALGCGGPQPSAPLPKTGYRDGKVSYEPKPDPLSTELKLPEVPLVEDQPLVIPSDQIPSVERHKTLAVEGVVQHPDNRMQSGAILVNLLIPNPKSPDGFTVANGGVVMATGKNGRLEYRAEVRVPDTGPQQYVLKLVYSGMRKIPEPGEEPESWTFPFAEGVLKVAGPPKPR